MNRTRRQLAAIVCALGALLGVPAAAAALDLRARPGAVDRPAARAAAARGGAHAARLRKITKPGWIAGFTVTEYYPVPEAWFRGARVRAPGIAGTHRIDWLYSARGVIMEGDGIGLDGRRYHVDSTGGAGWVDKFGRRTSIGGSQSVYWRAGAFYRNSRGWLTYPLDFGGWWNGVGVRYVPLRGVSFGAGPSMPLTYYRSIAVDPSYIPMGSRIYIPYYRNVSGGWFVAQDTGGAIGGKHLDVYRPPPPSFSDGGRYLVRQQVYVVPPRAGG
jgi:3D (Asp-Asp-Asp) domain-containing protein